jgi:hypothetical protein
MWNVTRLDSIVKSSTLRALVMVDTKAIAEVTQAISAWAPKVAMVVMARSKMNQGSLATQCQQSATWPLVSAPTYPLA